MNDHETERHDEPRRFDAEIERGSILRLGAGLAVVTVIAMALMWLLLRGFERHATKTAPPSPVLASEIRAATAQGPPGPQLQPNPYAEMAAMRAEEEALLDSYGWVDRSQGLVRVPIDRAMELLLESGVPHRAPAAPADAAQAGIP